MWKLPRRSFALLKSLQEYANALEFIETGKFALAEQELGRCLQIAQTAGDSAEQATIYSRLAVVQRVLSKPAQVEASLEAVVARTTGAANTTAKLNLLK